MADDKKDEPYEFVPPDFDEDAFIHRELTSFKTTAILFVWGIVAALASWAAFVGVAGTDMGWFIGLAICAVFGYSLKFLFPRLGADISYFKRKEWIGTGFLFFFTWLSFFVLVINPPITDIAPPQVFLHAGPSVQEPGGSVTIDALATDNGKVQTLVVKAFRDGSPLTLAFQNVGTDHLQAKMGSVAPGRYMLQATATDPKGHTTVQTTNFTVAPKTLDVRWPGGNAIADINSQVVVKVTGTHPCIDGYSRGADLDCIRTVHLKQTDGAADVALEYSQPDDYWRATSNFAGWAPGNHTYQVVAQYPDRFLAAERVPGGEITSSVLPLDMQLAPGAHTVTVPAQPLVRTVQVPGLSMPLLAAGLLGLAVMVRRARAPSP